MSWAGRPDLHLYLGARTVAACRGRELLLHDHVPAGVDPLDVASRWIAGQARRGGCAVWLGGVLCRPLLLPTPGGLQSAAERQRLAKALAQRDFACGDADVWLDGRGPGDLAVVLRAGLASALEQSFRRSPLKLRSLKPLWAAVLAQQLAAEPDCGLLGVADGESLTSLGGPGEGFALVESVVPQPVGDALAGAFQRAALRAGALPGTRRLVTLDLQAPCGGLPDAPFGPWLSEARP